MCANLEDVLVFFARELILYLQEVSVRKSRLCFWMKTEFFQQCQLYSLVMRLPSCHRSYDRFKSMMEFGLKGNDGFGGV